MYYVREEIKATFQEACQRIGQEKKLTVQNTLLIGKLYHLNAAVNLDMPERIFLKKLGLTKDQYYTRAMAARVLRRFPEYLEAYQCGDVGLSTLSLLAPKVTEANSKVILANIRGKTKRQARCFLSKVDYAGNVNDREGSVEITLSFKESDLKLLDEARSVLAAGGKVPTNREIILKALDDLLDRRDPVRKAERAAARILQRKAQPKGTSDRNENEVEPSVNNSPSDRNGEEEDQWKTSRRSGTKSRAAIPRADCHQVWLRDGRHCCYTYPDGSSCEETLMLELDHRQPWSRGGEHSAENLRVVCRRHNQRLAEDVFGAQFMVQFRSPGRRPSS